MVPTVILFLMNFSHTTKTVSGIYQLNKNLLHNYFMIIFQNILNYLEKKQINDWIVLHPVYVLSFILNC